MASHLVFGQELFHRTEANGARIGAIQIPNSKASCIIVAGDSSKLSDTQRTHGFRHLVEHLMMDRPGVDEKLEGIGGMSLASTLPDWIQIVVKVPSGQEHAAVEAIVRIIQPIDPSDARIAKEIKILGEEIALLEPTSQLASKMVPELFGGVRMGPIGEIETLKLATAPQLRSLQRLQFCSQNLAVIYVGSLPTKNGLALAQQIASAAPKAYGSWFDPPGEPTTKEIAHSEPIGSARVIGLRTERWNSAKALADWVAGFALTAIGEGRAEYTFQPSVRSNPLFCKIAESSFQRATEMFTAERDSYLGIGLQSAIQWCNPNPSDLVTYARGHIPFLMWGRRELSLEGIKSGLNKLTLDELQAAWLRWVGGAS